MAKGSIHLEDCLTKNGVLNYRKREDSEGKLFSKGKSVFLNARLIDMFDYLEKTELVIQLKNFLLEGSQNIGKTHLRMDAFVKDIELVIHDNIERFRRNTF